MKHRKKHKKHCCSKRNAYAVCIILALVVVVVFTSLFYRQTKIVKNNSDLCNLNWKCLDATANDTIKHLYGCNMYKWMNEYANKTHYQSPYQNQTVWYCLDECADQSVVKAFSGDRQRWMQKKSASKDSAGQKCLSHLDQQENIRIASVDPTTVFTGKVTGRKFTCAFSEKAKEGSSKTVCFGGVAQNPEQKSSYNQNCIWDSSISEVVDCP